MRRGRPRIRGLDSVSLCSSVFRRLRLPISPAVRHPMSGVLRLVRSYSLERRLSLWTPSAEPSRPRPRGAPAPSVLLRPLSRVLRLPLCCLSLLFPVVALLPVVFIPSRRNERLPRRDARAALPRPGCDPGPAVRRGPLVCSDRRTARWSVGDADPGTGALRPRPQDALAFDDDDHRRHTLARRVPQGWLRFPGGGGSFPGVTGRSVRRGPADGLRPASWSGTGPWPARVARDRRPAPQRGICSRIAYENVWPAGCWGSSPGRLYLFSPLPLPSHGPCLSRADSGRRAGTEGPRAGVLLCRPARRRAAAPGTAPPGSLQRRRPRRTEAIHRYHHIDGRCHLDLFKMLGTLDPDVHRPGARPRGVRRWARTAGGRRATPPGTGCRPGRDRRRAPSAAASVSASGDGLAFPLVERPAQLLAAHRPSGPVS